MVVNHFEFTCQVDEFSEFLRDLFHVYWFEIDKINNGKENDNNEFLLTRNSDDWVTIVHRWDVNDDQDHDPIMELNGERFKPGFMKITIDLSDDAIQFNWSRKILGIISAML